VCGAIRKVASQSGPSRCLLGGLLARTLSLSQDLVAQVNYDDEFLGVIWSGLGYGLVCGR
jgi:hypothetical protein